MGENYSGSTNFVGRKKIPDPIFQFLSSREASKPNKNVKPKSPASEPGIIRVVQKGCHLEGRNGLRGISE